MRCSQIKSKILLLGGENGKHLLKCLGTTDFAFEFRRHKGWGEGLPTWGEIFKAGDREKEIFLSLSWGKNVCMNSSDVTLNK